MGSGITKPILNVNNHEGYDLLRVLQSDRLTSAFMKYLDRIGKECFLTLYLNINHYKCTKNDHLLQQALKETISNHSTSCDAFSSQDSDITLSCKQKLLKMVEEVLDMISTSSTDVKKVEDFCFSQLSDELQPFLSSHEYSNAYKINLTASVGTVCRKELKNKYKNVLIIDDSPQNSRIMSLELKANGHHVRQANHGWVGTHIATLHHFDVILIDLAMNTMDPYDVIKCIKATKTKYNASPLVVGLNYSEYDLKSHGDVLFSINVGNLETSPKDFVTGFYKIISRCAELSRDKYETCDTSTTSSKLSVC